MLIKGPLVLKSEYSRRTSEWGRVTHICVSKLTIISSDNGLSPGQRQAIIWTNARILLIEPLETNFSEILIEIRKFSFKKMRLKMSSAKWRPFCLGLNELSAMSGRHTRDVYACIQKSLGVIIFHGCKFQLPSIQSRGTMTWFFLLFFKYSRTKISMNRITRVLSARNTWDSKLPSYCCSVMKVVYWRHQ